MKGKIKVLALIMAAAMVSSMFAACNNTPSDTPSTTDTPSNTESTDTPSDPVDEYSPKMAEPTTITWYMWDKQPTKTSLIDKANEMSKEAINVDVNFKWTAGVQETVNTLLASGEENLDLVFACAWYADYVGNAQKGYFKDLTEALPEYAPDLAAFLPEKLVNGIKIGGKLYGVPCWKDSAATQYWFARKDIIEKADAQAEFDQCGLEVASIKPVLEKIKAWHDADPANNAYSEGCTAPLNFNWAGLNGIDNGWDQLHGASMIGVRIKEGNTKVQSYIQDEAFRNDLKALKEFADLGLSNGKEAVQIEQEPTLVVFATAQGWDGAQYDAWGGPKKGYETIITEKCGPFLTSAYAAGGVTCIGKNSKNVEAALKYEQYLNMNEDFRNLMRYGEKGVDWEEVDGRANVINPDTWMLANFAVGTFKTLKVPTNVDADGNILDVQCPTDMYSGIADQVNTATASELLGFNVDITNVEDQLAAVTAVKEEMYKNLFCGVVDDVDAYCDQMLERMMKVGLQDVLDEFQSQVDAFLAA